MNAAGATQFFFTDACRLSIVGSPAELSIVLDSPGQFVAYHYVYLDRADSTSGFTETPVTCMAGLDLVLRCSVRDQNVLQLFLGLLSISATQQDGGPPVVFTLVEV